MIEDNSFHPLQRVETNTDNVIITEKELNYVETLYISYNKNLDYNEYIDIINICYDLNLQGDGVSGGRTWFKNEYYRIGIMGYEQAKSSKNYIVELQFKYAHLFDIKGDLSRLEFPFFLSNKLEDYRIKRIDVTKIFKVENFAFTPLDIGYISKMRKLNWYEGTLYIGSRKSRQVMRIYDKSKELKAKKNLEKIELLTNFFGDTENLYTCELELGAKTLKEKYDIITLDAYKKCIDIFDDVIGAIALYELNDKNRKLREQRNNKLIDKFYLANYKEVERMQREKYYHTKEEILFNKIKALYKLYEKEFINNTSDSLAFFNKLHKISKYASKDLEFYIDDKDTTIDYKKYSLKDINIAQHKNLMYQAKYFLTDTFKDERFIP